MICFHAMNRRNRAWVAAGLLGFASVLYAQLTGLEGDIKGLDGHLAVNAVVKISRIDANRNYQVKTDKKGHYFYSGLPTGLYSIAVQVDGKDIAAVTGIMTQPGTPLAIDIDCSDTPEVQAQKAILAVRRVRGEWSYIKPVTLQAPLVPAPANSVPRAKEPDRAATAAQKEAMEREVNDRATVARQREGLNEALNAGVDALEAKRYEEAIADFTKAGEAAPKQGIVWANLGAAYVGFAGTKVGAESDTALRKGLEAYATAATLKPDDAVIHNNYARALARAAMFKEMDIEVQKAADLDPSNAWRVFYNLGTLLTNTGQTDAAAKAFQRAIAAAPDEPGNAEAYYQYGLVLVSKAQVGQGGKIEPVAGTLDALRKYLQLAPNGVNAQGARDMLKSLGSSVDTRFTEPGAAKKKK